MTRGALALAAVALFAGCGATSSLPGGDAGALDASRPTEGESDAGRAEDGEAPSEDARPAEDAPDAAPFACRPDPNATFADREPNDLEERASPMAQDPLCGEVGGPGDDVDLFHATPKAPVLTLRVRLRGPGVVASLWRGAERVLDLTDGMDVEAAVQGGKLHRLEARSVDGARRSYEVWLRVGRESP